MRALVSVYTKTKSNPGFGFGGEITDDFLNSFFFSWYLVR
jgi:hypothetical protein